MSRKQPVTRAQVHPLADVRSRAVGAGTRIWQFVVVLPDAQVGRDCNICSHCFIENDVRIGDRVTIKNGVQLWDGLRVEDDVFIGPNVTFTNDGFPRSGAHQAEPLGTRICKGASLGAGATILPGLSVGSRAMVGAGSVVTRSVPANAIVFGNPARIVGYIDADVGYQKRAQSVSAPSEPGVATTKVRGVTIHRMPLIPDIRGSVTVGEFERTIPFAPKRYFMVLDVPSVETRGAHAHRQCHQFLICVHGQCAVVADDGEHRQEFRLDRPDVGIYLPAMIWGIQYKYSPDAVLLVFASEVYDPADYIRDYEEFRRLAEATV